MVAGAVQDSFPWVCVCVGGGHTLAHTIREIHTLSTFKHMLAINNCFDKRYRLYKPRVGLHLI